jgi:hypothetical protein
MPIITVFLNPLVSWIWIGLAVTVFGTLLALVPTLQLSRVAVPSLSSESAALEGHVPAGGD